MPGLCLQDRSRHPHAVFVLPSRSSLDCVSATALIVLEQLPAVISRKLFHDRRAGETQIRSTTAGLSVSVHKRLKRTLLSLSQQGPKAKIPEENPSLLLTGDWNQD